MIQTCFKVIGFVLQDVLLSDTQGQMKAMLIYYSSIPESNECLSNPCLNGAACKTIFNGFLCVCEPGFNGSLCEIGNTIIHNQYRIFHDLSRFCRAKSKLCTAKNDITILLKISSKAIFVTYLFAII